MAFDKVIDSSALDAGMTATANAIRAKTGGSSPIAWDHENGFKAAVDKISSGGGGGVALPELTNPGTDTDLAEGTQLIGADGSVVTGKLGVISRMQITTGNTSVQYNDTSIYVTGKRNSRAIIESGSTIRMDVSADKFGDARQSQVLEGTTFTSSNGLCLPGTMKATGGVVLPELGDTAAQPSDIAYGKVLYDDEGNPVTGTLGECTEGNKVMGLFTELLGTPGEATFDMNATYGYKYIGDNTKGVILRPGALLTPRDIPTSIFGNATADQVAKGATFTSAAGLLVEGTHECEAGVTLPELTNPATAADLALDKQLIDGSGNILTGTLPESGVDTNVMAADAAFWGNSLGNTQFSLSGVYSKGHIGDADFRGFICRPGTNFVLRNIPTSLFGDATADQVARGATFTSAAGLLVEGTMEAGSGGSSVGGLTVKTGTTTSNVIETGLSSIDYLIIQRYPVTTVGFTQGVYTASDDFMTFTYCNSVSQYINVNLFSKSSTVFSVDAGIFTWNGTDNAAFKGETYYWYAFGTE